MSAQDFRPLHVELAPCDQEKVEFRQAEEEGRQDDEKEKDMFESDRQFSLDLFDRRFFQSPLKLQGFALGRGSSVP
jgi:hypothetical protein